jgi:outer membrane protein TolC
LPFAVTGLVAQNSAPVPSISLPGSQSPFTGSEPEGKATPELLQLNFQEAIDRGLRNNLGLLISGDQAITARGERWKELSNLLPNLQAQLQENADRKPDRLGLEE